MADELRVGLTQVPAVVSGPSGERVSIDLLVDSGANYTLLPNDVWRRLGLLPKRTMTFRLADMTAMERAVSECHISVAERDGHTPVILGEPGDVALLGVVTLEVLGLVLDPLQRSIRPASVLPLLLSA